MLAMVISGFSEGLEQRIAHLRRCLVEQPDGPVWLWTIRLRILEFIAARYPRDQSIETSARRVEFRQLADNQAQELSDDTLGPALPWHAAPLPVSEHPPKTRGLLNPALERLQRVNDANRIRLDRQALPQDVWLWWREAWCCR